MGLSRAELGALGAAALLAVTMPLLLLPAHTPAIQPAAPPPALSLATPPEASALFGRSLFSGGGTSLEPERSDAPELIGIAGRIGTDAVALVRGIDGKSRTLAVGDAIDGWRLDSLAIEAAFFTRGAEQARVPLPAG